MYSSLSMDYTSTAYHTSHHCKIKAHANCILEYLLTGNGVDDHVTRLVEHAVSFWPDSLLIFQRLGCKENRESWGSKLTLLHLSRPIALLNLLDKITTGDI